MLRGVLITILTLYMLTLPHLIYGNSTSVTYRISVTIPAIAGFNVPVDDAESLEDTKETLDIETIYEDIRRDDQRIRLITIVPK